MSAMSSNSRATSALRIYALRGCPAGPTIAQPLVQAAQDACRNPLPDGRYAAGRPPSWWTPRAITYFATPSAAALLRQINRLLEEYAGLAGLRRQSGNAGQVAGDRALVVGRDRLLAGLHTVGRARRRADTVQVLAERVVGVAARVRGLRRRRRWIGRRG